MTCPACTLHAQRPTCGAYRMQCVACCARLVASARPLRQLQDGHLALIARDPSRPSRAAVLQHLKRANA